MMIVLELNEMKTKPNRSLASAPPTQIKLSRFYSGFNTNDHERNCRNTAPLANDVVELSFVVRDTGTHLALKGLHR